MTMPLLTIPAIVISQPVGDFFLCSIPAATLLKVTYSIPATMKRESGMFSSIFGNQRIQSKVRAKQIGAYIDEDESTFPNTIILSANYLEDGSYAEDESKRWHATMGGDGCFNLTIPSDIRMASIIDGQHRLEGFRHISKESRLDMGLPCAVFINLPREYQARIFATININQKRVDKSLAYELFGYDLNESNADKWPPDMLGVYLARVLEGKQDSPFKGHVRLALLEEKNESIVISDEENKWEVSVACIVEGITRLISEKPVVDRSALASGKINDRSLLPEDGAPLRRLYIDGKDKTLLELITAYFCVVEELLWKGQKEKSFIMRTVGVLALFDLMREALKENKLFIDDMHTSSRALLKKAQGIDFSDDYFHASGAGRVRIRNVLKKLVGLSSPNDEALDNVIRRLVSTRRQPWPEVDMSGQHPLR